MSHYARVERELLADLLLKVGPDVPTLCEGWTTRDLAAHLIVRDRRPDAALGLVVAPLAGHGEALRTRQAARPYADLVNEIRRPPWWSPLSNPIVHELTNTLEFFIHHEDVRRAGTHWQPRVLEPAREHALWGAVKLAARLSLRRMHVAVLVRAPGHGQVQVSAGPPQATLVGAPGELALFLAGRQRAAQVEVQAAPALQQRLRTARLGV